jgi:menaquinone-dependent protoporphyrinogen oxidase
MPRILVLYGTTDGHTARVATALADAMRSLGADVDVVNAKLRVPPPGPDVYAAVVVAASVHVGGYQRAVRRWLRAHASGLRHKPTAFVSVCLGVLQHDPSVDRDIERIMQRFFARTNWQPDVTHIVAGALPYTRYNWIKRWVMRRIAARMHGDTDTTRDFEYTDWQDLKAFARQCFELVRVSQRPARTA